MTTQNSETIIHDLEDTPLTTEVTFDIHTHLEGKIDEWGALRVEILTTDGNGGRHLTNLTHIITGPDWKQRAADIRQAFRSATFRR